MIEEGESIDIYGFVEYNVTDEAHRGLVKFNTTKPAQVTRIKSVPEWATAGAYAKENYYISYTSNGDGTCFVSGIVVKEAGVDVKIPKKSPDGDTVTAVKVSFSAA